MNHNANLKKKLRQNLITKRKQLTKSEVKDLNKKIFKNLNDKFGIEFFKNLSFVSGYMPFNNEAEVVTIMSWLNRNGVKTTLPRIHNDSIKFYEWNQYFPLIKNSLNIYEPLVGIEVIPKVLFIPLVGFDKNLNRLGHGFGHYDKKLSTMPNSIKIGIGYSLQEVEKIPIEEHDVKLDYIITNSICY